MTEWSAFKPKSALSTDGRLPLLIGCVQVKAFGDGAIASFQYTTEHGGAPERGWARKSIRISEGLWAQFEYNGRFSCEAAWIYRHTVLNVGCVEEENVKLFTHTRPAMRFASMGLLR